MFSYRYSISFGKRFETGRRDRHGFVLCNEAVFLRMMCCWTKHPPNGPSKALAHTYTNAPSGKRLLRNIYPDRKVRIPKGENAKVVLDKYWSSESRQRRPFRCPCELRYHEAYCDVLDRALLYRAGQIARKSKTPLHPKAPVVSETISVRQLWQPIHEKNKPF